MQPLVVNPNLMGQLEGFTHQASLIYWAESIAMAEFSDIIYWENQLLKRHWKL